MEAQQSDFPWESAKELATEATDVGIFGFEIKCQPTDQCVEEKGLSYKQIWKLSLPNYLTRLTGKMRLQYCPHGKPGSQFPE